MLLGGAVFLSAVGIIGTTDFEKLKTLKKKKLGANSKLKELEKRLDKLEDNIEDCCDISHNNKKLLQLLCIFVSKFICS